MCCFSSVLHFPKARNLHFWDSAVLCILQPEANSKIVITLSTNLNSHRFVIAGFKSSQKVYRMYLVSSGGRVFAVLFLVFCCFGGIGNRSGRPVSAGGGWLV